MVCLVEYYPYIFFVLIHNSWYFAVQCECQIIYKSKCLNRTIFMHILLQLIASKAAVFFISDEYSRWLLISLLLIISFSFDLDYDCSVRDTHLFIVFAWWDGLFGDCTDWCTLKNGFRSKLVSCESGHMAVAFSLYPKLSQLHVCFFNHQLLQKNIYINYTYTTKCLYLILLMLELYVQPTCSGVLCSWHEISTINIKRASPCAGKELNI